MNRMRWLIGILLALLVIGAAPAQETVTIPIKRSPSMSRAGRSGRRSRPPAGRPVRFPRGLDGCWPEQGCCWQGSATGCAGAGRPPYSPGEGDRQVYEKKRGKAGAPPSPCLSGPDGI